MDGLIARIARGLRSLVGEGGVTQVSAAVILAASVAAGGIGVAAGAAAKPLLDPASRELREAGLDFAQGSVGVGIFPQAKPAATAEPTPKATLKPTPRRRVVTETKVVKVTPKPEPRPPVVVYHHPQPPVTHTAVPPSHADCGC